MLPRLARFTRLLAAGGIAVRAAAARRLGGPRRRRQAGQCAFPAPCRGLDMGFGLASFSRGPASDGMAGGVYGPSGGDGRAYGAAGPGMPAPFRAAPFPGLASGQSAKWMRAASTQPAINIGCRKDHVRVRGRAEDLAWRSRGAVDDAFGEIEAGHVPAGPTITSPAFRRPAAPASSS